MYFSFGNLVYSKIMIEFIHLNKLRNSSVVGGKTYWYVSWKYSDHLYICSTSQMDCQYRSDEAVYQSLINST
jgi:hypothetical protein